MEVKSIDLFQAYGEGQVPREGGYIVTCFRQPNSDYVKYEVVGYSDLQSLYLSAEGLTFQADANKLFVLAEPAEYDQKHAEPYERAGQHQVPHHFSEMDQLTAGNMARILISRQPVSVYFSFYILRPGALNRSLLFRNVPGALDGLAAYFEQSLYMDAKLPAGDAAEAARRIVEGLKRFLVMQELVRKTPAPKAAPKARPKAAAKRKAKPRPAVQARKPAGKKAGGKAGKGKAGVARKGSRKR
jgi:hypothetical protein